MKASKLSAKTHNTTICDRCKHELTVPVPIPLLSPQTLHSDHVPSDFEISQTKEEIERLQTILRRLKEERNAVQKRLREHRGLVSALRRIPNEVWNEVFHFCIGDDEYSFSADDRGIWVTTLNISQVCSRWRRIVCAAPGLWTSFHVNLYKIERNVVPVIGLYISRSGKHPLQVCLADIRNEYQESSSDHSDGEREGGHVEAKIGKDGLAAAFLLLDNIGWFEKLEVDMDAGISDLLDRWDKPEDGASFCRLRALRIRDQSGIDTMTDVNHPLWIRLRGAPKLTLLHNLGYHILSLESHRLSSLMLLLEMTF